MEEIRAAKRRLKLSEDDVKELKVEVEADAKDTKQTSADADVDADEAEQEDASGTAQHTKEDNDEDEEVEEDDTAASGPNEEDDDADEEETTSDSSSGGAGATGSSATGSSATSSSGKRLGTLLAQTLPLRPPWRQRMQQLFGGYYAHTSPTTARHRADPVHQDHAGWPSRSGQTRELLVFARSRMLGHNCEP